MPREKRAPPAACFASSERELREQRAPRAFWYSHCPPNKVCSTSVAPCSVSILRRAPPGSASSMLCEQGPLRATPFASNALCEQRPLRAAGSESSRARECGSLRLSHESHRSSPQATEEVPVRFSPILLGMASVFVNQWHRRYRSVSRISRKGDGRPPQKPADGRVITALRSGDPPYPPRGLAIGIGRGDSTPRARPFANFSLLRREICVGCARSAHVHEICAVRASDSTGASLRGIRCSRPLS